MEARLAERLTPRSPDPEVRSLAHRLSVFRQGTLLHFVSLHRVAMGISDTLLGGKPAIDWHPVQGGVAILIGMFHAG